jgi:hypothetical protein
MTSTQTAIDQLNVKYPIYLQLFTWHHLRLANGTDTKIIALDESSFTVRVKDGGQEKVHVYKFNSEDTGKFRDLKTRTEKVLSTFIGPHTPPLGIHIVSVWLFGILACIPVTYVKDFDVLVNAKGWLMKLFVKEEYAIYFLIFLVVSHLFEMLYALFVLLPSLDLPMSKFAPWAIYVYVMGFPITMRLGALSRMAKKLKQQKKSS